MRPGAWFVATVVAAGLGWGLEARAQDAAVPAEAPPPEQFPPPPPTGVYRLVSVTVAIGPGTLIGPGERTLAISHNVLRFGLGLGPNLTFYASLEGAHAPGVNPRTQASSWLRQDTVSLGIQRHFRERFYLRGSTGAGFVREQTSRQTFSGGTGVALTAAAGYELALLPRNAIALELAGNLTHYPRYRELWGTAGVNLTLTYF